MALSRAQTSALDTKLFSIIDTGNLIMRECFHYNTHALFTEKLTKKLKNAHVKESENKFLDLSETHLPSKFGGIHSLVIV